MKTPQPPQGPPPRIPSADETPADLEALRLKSPPAPSLGGLVSRAEPSRPSSHHTPWKQGLVDPPSSDHPGGYHARTTVRLELGSEGSMGTSALPAWGPRLGLTLARHGGSERLLSAWQSTRLGLGLTQELLGAPTRLDVGGDLAGGLSLRQAGKAVEVGWNMGVRLLTPGENPDLKQEQGWIYLVTGPVLGLRLGRTDAPGILLRLEANAYWLDTNTDGAYNPQLQPRFGIWVGRELR